MSSRVRITDVSPRDGLQNEPGVIPTRDKARLVELLASTGVDEVEVTSFVSPTRIPQLADAAELVRELRPPQAHGCRFSALVPNERGLQGVLDANQRVGKGLISKVSVFTAASETFARRNVNASIAETIERFVPIVRRADAEGLEVRGYVSCAIACPFEGPIAPERVVGVCRRLWDIGVRELDVADTIGAGTAESVWAMLDAVLAEFPGVRGDGSTSGAGLLTLHLHDTFGRAVECVRSALRVGVRSFDGAVGGLGGCPYASTPTRRAPGNIDTRSLVAAIQDSGFETGVDARRLDEAAAWASSIVAVSRAESAR